MSRPSSLPDPIPPPQAVVERAIRTSPHCGRELAERRCRRFCQGPGCGCDLGCADSC